MKKRRWIVSPAAMNVDYKRMITMPIRDMDRDGKVVFCVNVYGVDPSDLATIPGGSRPMVKAVERLGLDPLRYQALLWDIPV